MKFVLYFATLNWNFSVEHKLFEAELSTIYQFVEAVWKDMFAMLDLILNDEDLTK